MKVRRNEIIATIVMIIICCSSFAIAIPSINNESNDTIIVTLNEVGDPPDWAMGTFNGTYGYLKNGNPSTELGRFEGYWESISIGYTLFEKGRIQGEFFEDESLIPNWEFSAKLISKDITAYRKATIFGKIKNVQEDKTYLISGNGQIYFDGRLDIKMYIIFSDNLYLDGQWIRYI